MIYLQIDKLFSTFLKEKQYLQGASPATVRSYSKAWLAYKHYVGCIRQLTCASLLPQLRNESCRPTRRKS